MRKSWLSHGEISIPKFWCPSDHRWPWVAEKGGHHTSPLNTAHSHTSGFDHLGSNESLLPWYPCVHYSHGMCQQQRLGWGSLQSLPKWKTVTKKAKIGGKAHENNLMATAEDKIVSELTWNFLREHLQQAGNNVEKGLKFCKSWERQAIKFVSLLKYPPTEQAQRGLEKFKLYNLCLICLPQQLASWIQDHCLMLPLYMSKFLA